MAFAIQNTTAHYLFSHIQQDPRVGSFLQKLRHHHIETFDHSLRVGLLAIDLGLENQVSRKCLMILGKAAMLHDIGKLKIPISLLSKPKRLTFREMHQLRDHPRLGYEMLQDLKPPEIAEIIVDHHTFANDPYPDERCKPICLENKPLIAVTGTANNNGRLSTAEIESLTQMVAAADLFDALTSHRAYKSPYTFSDTCKAMQKQYCGNPTYVRQILSRW